MPNPISITTALNQDYIPANGTARLAYLLIEIQPGDSSAGSGDAAPTTLPVNLAFVVDMSDSMRIPILSQSQFEELARTGAVKEAIVDGVAVWRFENTPASHTLNAPRNVDFVKKALHTALEKLAPRDQFSLVAFAREARTLIEPQSGQHKRALLQTIDELENLKLGDETFIAEGMKQGFDLIQRSFANDRVNRLIVLTDGFTRDDAACRALAHQAAQSGISISTLGLGVEFNEELLISIADTSGGNAYFITNPAEIPSAFNRELSGAQNIILRNLHLKMRFMPGVELRRAHRVQPMISDLGALPTPDNSLHLALGELGRGSALAYLFELAVPPRIEGAYQLAHLLVEYDEPARGLGGQKIRQDCVMHYAANAPNARVNPRVMNLVEKVSAFRWQTRALADAARGDIPGATQKLRAAATRLINMGERDLAQAALNEAANLEQRGKMSSAGTKQLRYDTRRLTQK